MNIRTNIWHILSQLPARNQSWQRTGSWISLMVFSNYSMFLLDYQINVVMRHTTSPAPTRLSRASIGIQSIDAGPLRRRDNRLSKEHIMCTLLRKGQKNKKTIEGWHYSLCGKMNKSSDMPDFLHCDRKASQMPDNQSLSISQYTSYDVSRQLKTAIGGYICLRHWLNIAFDLCSLMTA